jgi:hypothetical protein
LIYNLEYMSGNSEQPREKIYVGGYVCSFRPVVTAEKKSPFISEPPIGLETLSSKGIQNILNCANLPINDPAGLNTLTPSQLYTLADEFPDCAEATALRERAKLINEASQHSGFNIPGARDAETLVGDIREAFNGPEKKPVSEDEFPF